MQVEMIMITTTRLMWQPTQIVRLPVKESGKMGFGDFFVKTQTIVFVCLKMVLWITPPLMTLTEIFHIILVRGKFLHILELLGIIATKSM